MLKAVTLKFTFPSRSYNILYSGKRKCQSYNLLRNKIPCLGKLQALNICTHIIFSLYLSVWLWGPALCQWKQDSAVLMLKFTRMAKNIVTHTNSTLHLLVIYTALRPSTALFPSLIFSISDTHKHVQWLPYGFFFSDTEINKRLCLLLGLPCRQISGF